MLKELHSIKRFRDGRLGIIRLNKLAIPKNIIIKLGEKEFKPIGYDTYGHPIISESNFIYYKALKSIRERQGESLVAEVEYQPNSFVIRKDVYDSVEGLNAAATSEQGLKSLKEILNYRKQANFIKKELNTFILFEKYALYNDGHIYACSYKKKCETDPDKVILELSEVINFELHEEIHIPGHKDVCEICGKEFDIDDVKNYAVAEDENKRKVHNDCLISYTEDVNYQKASQIIDSVYQDIPNSEIIRECEEGKKEKVWYLYHTKQGDVAIRFKNKVIVIKWYGNFKPFNLNDLFKDEDVTKRKLEDAKVIHAWSTDDAIKYLMMVRKS